MADGVHSDAVDAAVQGEHHRAVGGGRGQAEHEHVPGLRFRGEGRHVGGSEDGARTVLGAALVLLPQHTQQRARGHGQVPFGGEDDRFLGFGALGGDLGPGGQQHGLGLGGRQPESDVGAGRRRREEGHAKEVQEGEVVLVRDPVEPVDELVGHVGDGFDECDAGVGDVVVGPLRGALLDVALGVVDELLEVPVVEVGGGQGHGGHTSPSLDGIT